MRPALLALLFSISAAVAQPPAAGALSVVPLEKLSERPNTALSQQAMMVKKDWQHAETEHFIYHFSDEPTAAAVSVEAEFSYRVIAGELGRDTAKWERKCHVFLFSNEGEWKIFQAVGSLDRWSGGIHSQGALFLYRSPGWMAREQTLPHEISHLVFERFVGAGVPLWLNEGFADYAATRCQAAFYRARGYAAKPRAQAVPEALYLPVAKLIDTAMYPSDEAKVSAFYDESEKLVRFLAGVDKKAFVGFLDAMGKGAKFESALSGNFGSRFTSLDALDREFKPYATSQMHPN